MATPSRGGSLGPRRWRRRRRAGRAGLGEQPRGQRRRRLQGLRPRGQRSRARPRGLDAAARQADKILRRGRPEPARVQEAVERRSARTSAAVFAPATRTAAGSTPAVRESRARGRARRRRHDATLLRPSADRAGILEPPGCPSLRSGHGVRTSSPASAAQRRRSQPETSTRTRDGSATSVSVPPFLSPASRFTPSVPAFRSGVDFQAPERHWRGAATA